MPGSTFHPTRWTLVLRACGEGEAAKLALSDLCEAYYGPVVAFLRLDGRNEDAAREMAHAFFESVLESGVGTPDPQRGRFRSYLLGALKHFLSKQRDAALAEKRGGGAEHVPMLGETDTFPGLPMPGVLDDTLAFDREWALALIGRALATLEAEQIGREFVFSTLKPWLDGGADGSQAEAARTLGMSETAVKVAIHRLRSRFRELIRTEVAATVNDPEEVTGELRHLIAVASRG
ncbi:MAG: sigma-70 family RNA polymerase sigma factor [Akkermansiaceae bacterium]|jgi:RNA polymerase sigma-70 factor (ECF subfamily)|nr:sigma-70 family RNA polymerase sigma factor [Akkermansiaceae bacterium]